MAFDQATRNRLQRFVTDARRALEEEFTRQLQNDFGMDPVAGTVTPIESLRHINDQQRETARILRDTLDHYCAGGDMDTKAGLDRIVREQAFTVLNRLAALRMAEARGLLIETVGNGFQAKGFQLYARLAGTGLGETGDAYRVYLQSVFDELSLDLPGLFDRYSPQGRLFPREAALLQVLALINHGEIEPLWAEDETIGWIYQYFNSKEERKAMRDASQAPRNSRELAVRNQFFTPRYVVEFLVDNTLGRLWFNWTGGQTSLRDRCQYLLVKPNEWPEVTQRLRDPRTIKLLDPACGSMHFGLYAFDLFQEVYREAWDWEQAHGSGGLDRETSGRPDLKPLSATYADQDAFLRDVPRLIIEHNIYGVDIDPRAAQIASLALWLRAQRAWHDTGAKAKDRPNIGSGQVVAAVAPPAEVDLRKRFMAELAPLDAELFEKTLFLLKDLPVLGVLLQVERELPALIRLVFGEHGDLFHADDMLQWQKAETRLREALTDYAHATRSTFQGRLFAEDALQGLRMIDHCREVFDVVVMNPPFGLPSSSARNYIDEQYMGAHGDIYASFVARAMEMAPDGFVGCITSSSFLLSPRMEAFRKRLLPRLGCVADCGLGVMDDAMVRSAIYILEPNQLPFFRVANAKSHLNSIKHGAPAKLFCELFSDTEKQFFADLPQSRLLIDAPQNVRDLLAHGPYFEPNAGTAREGMKTFDNERFIRLPWEVVGSAIGKGKKWHWLVKGGEFSFFYSEVHLLLNWANDGAELKEININLNGSTAQVRQASTFWGREGATYSKRSSGFSARILPKDCIFTSNGPAILPLNDTDPLYLLGWLNSRPIRALTHLNAGAFDSYSTGALKRLPWKAPDSSQKERLRASVASAVTAAKQLASLSNECSSWFAKLPIHPKLNMIKAEFERLSAEKVERESVALATGDLVVSSVYELTSLDWTIPFVGGEPDPIESVSSDEGESAQLTPSTAFTDAEVSYRTISYLVGVVFNRWAPTFDECVEITKALNSPVAALPCVPPGASSSLHGVASGISVLPTGALSELIRARLASLVEAADDLERECLDALDAGTLDAYLDDPKAFFARHLSGYTASKRAAPIYWPLSTASGSYTLWLYYPSLTGQTLYTAINDFIEPKLKQVDQDVAALRNKGSARSFDDEKTFEALQNLELELIEFRDTLLQIAPTYHPNQDDGVPIAAAPLWQLFRHKPWQKILKDTWANLEKGDYDWAHLAMAYWPSRVRGKCETDKSLAIAHDLEHLYVETEPKTAKARGRMKDAE
ncbi:hypothetical protein GGQ88_003977 [Novosphingobium hassiacum]|uniref:site-specific DNA-methyltransferase (adenine-specific) n=1 Tax=Novosphingobium hassiacum TaxID=173676 RepID=A0A7W5ZZ20_9SPHN|nr:BREX-1 system adenine-specific DNA-methyltransferase PglX [Novosphingobium hassiacum]MBB3862675.1 hypothetical protein [Novosphingobium hassiacum]